VWCLRVDGILAWHANELGGVGDGDVALGMGWWEH
jgi:hypothetical protein